MCGRSLSLKAASHVSATKHYLCLCEYSTEMFYKTASIKTTPGVDPDWLKH